MTQVSVASLDASASRADFENQLLSVLPALRNFGRRCAANASDVEDLVQETMVKALSREDLFTPGTNMRSWTFTILKNLYITEYKNRKREPNLGIDSLNESLHVGPAQEWALRQSEMVRVLNQMTRENRETLLAVAMGQTYDDTAVSHGCEVGTVKSRVSRARSRLATSLGSLTGQDVYTACL